MNNARALTILHNAQFHILTGINEPDYRKELDEHRFLELLPLPRIGFTCLSRLEALRLSANRGVISETAIGTAIRILQACETLVTFQGEKKP